MINIGKGGVTTPDHFQVKLLSPTGNEVLLILLFISLLPVPLWEELCVLILGYSQYQRNSKNTFNSAVKHAMFAVSKLSTLIVSHNYTWCHIYFVCFIT